MLKTYTVFEIKCLHITSRVTSNEKDRTMKYEYISNKYMYLLVLIIFDYI